MSLRPDRIFPCGLLALALALPGTAAAARDIVAEGRSAGLDAAALERAKDRMRGSGFPGDRVEEILAFAVEAARKGLPAGPLLEKIEEGLAKGASPEAVAQAAAHRADCLQEAARLVDASVGGCNSEAGRSLVAAAALCLESGMEAERLGRVLGAGSSGHALRMAAAMEAGEALHLAGLDHDTVEALMADFVRRNLRRGEILRAVDFAAARHREGLKGPDIVAALWPAAPK